MEPSRLRHNSLQPTKELLNPRFEAYRLVTADDGAAPDGFSQTEHDLPGSALTGFVDDPLKLAYKTLKSRFFHRYLCPSKGGSDHLVYIDKQGFVILVTFQAGFKPSFHPLLRLDVDPTVALPSIASCGDHLWLAHDGRSDSPLRLLSTQREAISKSPLSTPRWSAEVLHEYSLPDSCSKRGIKVVDGYTHTNGEFHVLLQAETHRPDNVDHGSKGEKLDNQNQPRPSAKAFGFEISLVHLPAPSSKSGDEAGDSTVGVTSAQLVYRLIGDEPLYIAVLSGRAPETWSLLSEGPLQAVTMDLAAKPTVALTSPSANPGQPALMSDTEKCNISPAYSWAQTADTVTIAFSLPPTLNKADIRVHFSPPSGFSLMLSTEADLGNPKIYELPSNHTTSESTPDSYAKILALAMQRGRYEGRSLWGPIDMEGSLWTWEKARSPSDKSSVIGLLTVHLEKKHEGTRWTHVFAPSLEEESVETSRLSLTDDVDETVDPSELLEARGGLQKYTAVEGSAGAADLGIDRTGMAGPHTSLLQDEMEEEDASVGRPLQITTISMGDSNQSPSIDRTTTTSKILCLPLPTSSVSQIPCVAIQANLDGCLWTFEHGNLLHVETIPALSYVLASKREAHRCHCITSSRGSNSQGVCFAFEGPTPGLASRATGVSGAGSLFFYRSPPRDQSTGKQSLYGESRVIALGKNDTGALLDVTLVPHGASSSPDAVVCLTEHKLLVLQGLL
ncbi:hypothetical protein K437DRAFT_138931 [Tilletiaria anomala UBC 951]|uniref:NudC domain-containing protein 1 n=1 Tax=Tilletiaria anomala (strain ATCC 24038 / CBS 436.72 / UBC 951) TaxID=1037660 RepID=A0A066VRQ3_TILAU|nr:uncharacterized protein K437DRAFT_138931 [Tilletiaria anomala UBC 951]KDN44382.1 hypothetical protein K437DRAFT_138931 [Tilletiaria anomala UBC 951]